jgi:hypothetical protein
VTVWIKQGVLGDLRAVAQKGFGRVADLYARHSEDVFVTSKRESNHWGGSLHYIGLAFDIRRGHRSLLEVKNTLGHGWDVLEYEDLGIFHCEYDPKE